MSAEKKEPLRVGHIGDSLRGIPAQCIDAAGESQRIRIIELTPESNRKGLGLIQRKLTGLANLVVTMAGIVRVDIAFVVFVDKRAKWYLRIARLLRKKAVLYWTGSDVANLTSGALSPKGLEKADVNFAASVGNIEELAQKGVRADYLFTPTALPQEVAKMPERHSVLLSIPDNRMEFYGYSDLMRLVGDYPAIEFHIVRTEHPEFYDRPNIVFEGMLDGESMSRVFDRISISIRWPKHDGTSFILAESALKGKYIISRNPFPVGLIATTYEELCTALDRILRMPLEPCMEYRAYALEHFTQESAGRQLAECFIGLQARDGK